MKIYREIGRYIRIMLAAWVMISTSVSINGQELNCVVEVNAQQVEGTNKSVFETLQNDIKEYFNSRQWTNTQFSPIERIDCRFFLTVNEYTDGRVKGELQVQLSRPVFNSTYTTTVLNFRDTKIEFDYQENDPLQFNETTWENNLTGILNFYAYLFLALDFDTFSPQGGQPYYEKAATIVQWAQSSGEVGWRTFEDTRNRSALLSFFTDGNTSGYRNLLYNFHRKGLDEMVTSPDKGRATITESLNELQKIHDVAPMTVGLALFRDSKLDELVNIYSKAPQTERDLVYDLLKNIYPTDMDRLEKIKNPPEIR